MRLGGWHRLWIVLCAVYFGVTATFFAFNWPTPEGVSHSPELYGRLQPDFLKKILGSEPGGPESQGGTIEVRMPNRHVIPFSAKVSLKESEKVAAEYWRIVEEEAGRRRRTLLLRAAVIWLLPCVVFYALGWSTAWVIRGFRHT